MKYIVTLNGKKYEVEVDETQAVLLGVSEEKPPASDSPSAAAQTPAAPSENTSKSDEGAVNGIKIKSPMPGTVLAVNLSEGAQVKKGDVLFVLEAMKMENDIVAPENGVAKKVFVSKGDSVNTDDILGII
ncbi:MAG: Glutaconyl-CoA decarboxylase subunit gamma [Firmicutes bacterium ADurb.Bin300]|jgi:biotin carboxyl carrier protein|nr:MAG: Glutaconyl-CoA decarboxylase subunit gamma [Firmicutes bacterium ADurb.Bin300]HOD02351.1 biotin/lipoyl-binding protein [Clostridiales bacterium]